MTDTKKCGAFLVKIRRLTDGKCIVFSERPSDVLVLDLFSLVNPKADFSHFRFVSRDTTVAMVITIGEDVDSVVEGGYSYPVRFTQRAPHRLLKRRRWVSHCFTARIATSQAEALVRRLLKAGYEYR